MATKCYLPVFTIEKRKPTPDVGRGRREFLPPQKISLAKILIRSGLFRDKAVVESVKQLIVCCDSVPAPIEDANSINRLQKFITNSDIPNYKLLENLLCKYLYDMEEDCDNIDGLEARIINVEMQDVSKLVGGNAETAALIQTFKTFCDKCQENQDGNIYNDHFCSGEFDDAPEPKDEPFANIPPSMPDSDPPPVGPAGDLSGLLEPDPPVQDQSETIPEGDLDNKFSVKIFDPCEKDPFGGPQEKEITFGMKTVIDLEIADKEVKDLEKAIHDWMNNPDNQKKIEDSIIDISTGDSIRQCVVKGIRALVSNTPNDVPLAGTAVEWKNHMSTLNSFQIFTDTFRNTVTGFGPEDCELLWNVLPTGAQPVAKAGQNGWDSVGFPVSFLIRLPSIAILDGNKNPVPQPPPIPLPGPLYFQLLNAINNISGAANTYNPTYNQIIADLQSGLPIVEDQPRPVLGIFNNRGSNFIFSPYGETQLDDSGAAIPIFNEFLFNDFIKVGVRVSAKFIAERKIISGNCSIKVTCKEIEADVEKPDDLDCSNIPTSSMRYEDKKPNAKFLNDAANPFDGNGIGGDHFNNNALIIIDKDNEETWPTINTKNISVFFKIDLVYKKTRSTTFNGTIFINPFHPNPNLRLTKNYFTEIDSHYTLVLPKKDAQAVLDKKSPYTTVPVNSSSYKTHEESISNYIKEQIKKIQNPTIVVDANGKNVESIEIPESTKQAITDVFSAKIIAKNKNCCCCKWEPASNQLSDVTHKLMLPNLDKLDRITFSVEPHPSCTNDVADGEVQ